MKFSDQPPCLSAIQGSAFVSVQRRIELVQEIERNGLGSLKFMAMSGV
jgi:hypothetical protein